MKRAVLIGTLLFSSVAAAGAAEPIRLSVIQDASGSAVLEDYSRQFYQGFDLGLEYVTKGTMQAIGRAIEVTKQDTNVKPDRARSLLAQAYENGADIAIGSTSSGVTKAMLPVANEYEKILLVAPAVADSITGADWNRYIFKSSRNNSFDIQAQAIAMHLTPDTAIGIIGEDYAFVHDGAAALKAAVAPSEAKVIAEEYVPMDAADLTPALERLANKMSAHKGRKILFAYFAILPNYMGKIKNWGPERYGLEVSAVINTLTSLESFKVAPGMEGGAFYYYELPKNPINDWLVAAMKKRYNAPPDYFTVEGFTAAIAAITGIEKAKSTQPEAVIKAMEGMEFDSPRGKMTFRAEDHQAMMPMYDIRLKNVDGLNRAVPELVREISASEFKIPIRNKR